MGATTPAKWPSASAYDSTRTTGKTHRASNTLITNVCSAANRFTAANPANCGPSALRRASNTYVRIKKKPTASPTRNASRTAHSYRTQRLKIKREPKLAAAAVPPASKKYRNCWFTLSHRHFHRLRCRAGCQARHIATETDALGDSAILRVVIGSVCHPQALHRQRNRRQMLKITGVANGLCMAVTACTQGHEIFIAQA